MQLISASLLPPSLTVIIVKVFIIRQGSDYDKEFLNQGAGSSDKVLYVNIEDAKKPFLQLFCKGI